MYGAKCSDNTNSPFQQLHILKRSDVIQLKTAHTSAVYHETYRTYLLS